MRIWVDETKAKGYVVVAVTAPSDHVLPDLRTALESMVLRGQRGLHMKDERDSRRRQIADTIVRVGRGCDLSAVVYDAGRCGTEKERRERCLAALVKDAVAHRDLRIVFDLDESLLQWDRQQMIRLIRRAEAGGRIVYDHQARHAETLLAIPDAVAWSWARGGEWRTRIAPIISEVRSV